MLAVPPPLRAVDELWDALLAARTGPPEELEAALQPVLHAQPGEGGGDEPALARLLVDEAGALLEARQLSARLRRPHVTLCYAQTLDGRIATASGSSRWISGQASLIHAHRLRALCDAVLVGAVTARHDDPALTVRHVAGPNPRRFVIDSQLDGPPARQLLATPPSTVYATSDRAAAEPRARLERAGVEVWTLPGQTGEVDLPALLGRMAEVGIGSLLVEGGARTLTSFVRHGFHDRLVITLAPLLLGEGISAIGELGIRELSLARRFTRLRYHRLEPDLIVDARPGPPAS